MLDTVVWLNWRGLEGAQYAHVSVRVIRWTTQGSHLGAVSVLRGCCCVCCQHGIVVHIPGTCAVKTTGQTTTQEVDQHAVAYYEQPNAICEGLTQTRSAKWVPCFHNKHTIKQPWAERHYHQHQNEVWAKRGVDEARPPTKRSQRWVERDERKKKRERGTRQRKGTKCGSAEATGISATIGPKLTLHLFLHAFAGIQVAILFFRAPLHLVRGRGHAFVLLHAPACQTRNPW